MQWVQKVQIPEKYVVMSEPDHVWLKCAGPKRLHADAA